MSLPRNSTFPLILALSLSLCTLDVSAYGQGGRQNDPKFSAALLRMMKYGCTSVGRHSNGIEQLLACASAQDQFWPTEKRFNSFVGSGAFPAHNLAGTATGINVLCAIRWGVVCDPKIAELLPPDLGRTNVLDVHGKLIHDDRYGAASVTYIYDAPPQKSGIATAPIKATGHSTVYIACDRTIETHFHNYQCINHQSESQNPYLKYIMAEGEIGKLHFLQDLPVPSAYQSGRRVAQAQLNVALPYCTLTGVSASIPGFTGRSAEKDDNYGVDSFKRTGSEIELAASSFLHKPYKVILKCKLGGSDHLNTVTATDIMGISVAFEK